MRRIKSMRGIEIYETSDGPERVGIVYYVGGKARREMVGDVQPDPATRSDVTAIKARKRLDGRYKDCPNCVRAVGILAERRAAVRAAKREGVAFLTPKQRAEAEEVARKEAERKAQGDREPLIYESAWDRFYKACGSGYSRPKEVRQRFEIMGRAFNGRHLGEITTRAIRQYVADRTNRTGPFEGWPHAVGMRPAQVEINQLSALYGWIAEEEEREIENPCSRYRSRRSQKKSETYRPVRKGVIPEPEQIAAIFEAATMDPKRDRFARHLPGQPVRAFLKLCYYTGARPESDAATLTNGDVTPSDPKVCWPSGVTKMGTVRFVRAKTLSGDREIPMHPALEADLLAVMGERPSDPAKLAAWLARPIFRRRGKEKPWDKSSYQKAWGEILERIAEAHPNLAGMIVRDFRKTARTALTNARIPEPLIRWFMGHARNVSQGYFEPTADAAEEAVLALSLGVKPGTVHETAHRPTRPVLVATGTDANR